MNYRFTLKPLTFHLEYSGTVDGKVLKYYTAKGIGDIEFMVALKGKQWHADLFMIERGEVFRQEVGSKDEGERVCMEQYYKYVAQFVTVSEKEYNV